MLANQWLKKHNRQTRIYQGFSEMSNGVQLYKVHYDWFAPEAGSDNPRFADIKKLGFRGIISENGNEVRHSEVPKRF